MITRELLEQKRGEYRNEWLRLMSLAAANEGAMQAIDDLLAHYDDTADDDGKIYDLRGLVEGMQDDHESK